MMESDCSTSTTSAQSECIAVIGGGWYGCHIALKLSQEGHCVTLYEAKDDLFRGVSGSYGIRMHAGPHYPRSEVTRTEVQATLLPMLQEYPQLFVETNAIYALGTTDVDGNPPRVDWPHFQKVCEECYNAKEVSLNKDHYSNLIGAYSVFEPSLHMDKPRDYFRKALSEAGVQVLLNHKVTQLDTTTESTVVDGHSYDWAINCTYYQDFNPLTKFMGAQICYQACCTLLYEEIGEKNAPFSFTIVEGWFLNLMPYTKYDSQHVVLYHAKYTILDTFTNMKDCQALLDSLDDRWVQQNLKPRMEKDAQRFFPNFLKQYKYIGFKCAAATKIQNAHEFRSSLVWAQERIINVFSGKVNNICEAAEEVKKLIKEAQSKYSTPKIRQLILPHDSDQLIVAESVVRAEKEIKNQQIDSEKDTCSLSKANWTKVQVTQPQRSCLVDKRDSKRIGRWSCFRNLFQDIFTK